MKIELVLKSPTVSIPVSFSASSPSGGDAHNGIPSGGSNGDILVKVGKEEYDAEWKPVDEALSDFSQQVQDALDEQSKKTEESLEQKLDKTDAERIVYANNAQGIPTPLGFNDKPTGSSVVQRTKDGQVKATPAVEDNDAVTLSQMNESVGVKSSVTVDGKVVLEFPADTYIAEAISAIVNSAPATLDTLAEIAKALGDDPNFATTILTKLGEKADATATNEALAGKSAVKVGGAVVEEFDADTKMDRPNNTTGAIKVIAVNWNNTIGLQGLGSTPQADRIAMFTSRKTLQTEAATDAKDAVNLAQMNAALSEKASVKTVDTLAKKVENLEAGISPDMFVVDDTTAYVKDIPTDAKPYAQILAVGGMTYLSEGMDADLSVLVEDDNSYDIGINAEYGTIRVGVPPVSTSYTTSAPFSSIFKGAEIGKTYMLTYTVSGSTGGFMDIGKWPNRPNLNVPFTLTSDIYNSGIEFYNSQIDTEAGLYADTAYFSNLKLTEIGGATRYAKVTEIVSKGIYGNVIGTLRIPAEVQSLDGYGETGYRIEWDEDGKPWWVTPDTRTDISHLLTEDNLIPVEGGGTITAVNAEGLAAPTTIVYQATGQSIADAFDEVHEYAQSILNGGSN